MTLTDVKDLLGITDTASDTQITAMLPLVINAIERECCTVFDVVNDKTIVPDGLKIVVAYDIGVMLNKTGVKTMSLGDYSVTYDGTQTSQRDGIVNSFKRTDVW